MTDQNVNIDVWILKELRQLGIPLPKLKKIRLQIHKKNQKSKASGTFGVCLSKLEHDSPDLSTTVIPLFLKKMVGFLSKHVTRNCIFRKNGNQDRMTQLQERLETGTDLTDESVEDVAGILKSWFRNLPVSLIPEDFHDLFITCHKACETTSSSKALLLACSLLPAEHLATLKYTLEFLASVAKHSDINKMSPQSLAIVFAPNIMPIMNKRKLDKSFSIEVLKDMQQMAMSVVQWLIEHSEEVKKTPQSVEFLAQLSTQTSEKNNRTKTKRRKSMCDIVGVKIKKMVAPHSDNNHPTRARQAPVLKHKAECKSAHNIPTKRSKNNVEIPPEEADNDLHFTGRRKDEDIISIRIESVKPDYSHSQKEIMKQSCSSSTSVGGSVKCLTDHKTNEEFLQQSPVHQSELGLVKYDESLKTVITVNQSPVYKTPPLLATPSKEENGKIERPRSTLKRGKPNSINSGLKDGRKGNLKCSTSLENLVQPFEKLQVSKRRSRSASSVNDRSRDQDSAQIIQNLTTPSLNEDLNEIFSSNRSQDNQRNEMLNNSTSSVSINRVLDFFNLDEDQLSSSSDCCKNAFTSPVGTKNIVASSFGFSPILTSSNDSDSGTENVGHETWSTGPSNVSRNPFEDITNNSEIPTLNSSIGDNSIFDICEKSIPDQHEPLLSQCVDIKDHFYTPSPITNKASLKNNTKLSITASSTPASTSNKILWQDATSYGFSKIEDDNVEGPKRESIIKLKETNAGKVLANINLYNNRINQNGSRFSRSPALPRNLGLERNCFATKSVRERSKPFADVQGFKVPSMCPSSIKRAPQRAKFTLSCPVSKYTVLADPFKNTVDENASGILLSQSDKKIITQSMSGLQKVIPGEVVDVNGTDMSCDLIV